MRSGAVLGRSLADPKAGDLIFFDICVCVRAHMRFLLQAVLGSLRVVFSTFGTVLGALERSWGGLGAHLRPGFSEPDGV